MSAGDAPMPRSPTADVYAYEADDAALRSWWRRVALVGGVVSVTLGLILVIWPDATLYVAAILIGLWLILSGAVRVAQAAFIPEGRGAGARVLQALVGVVFVIVGVLCMKNLTTSLTLLALIIGIAWLFGGIMEIFMAFSPSVQGWGRFGALLLGVIAIAAAVTILVWPEPSLRVLVWVTGLWLLALGLVQLFLAWRARKAIPA
jgi:uncharacterized membrane protein HdeD (DUF308 family)